MENFDLIVTVIESILSLAVLGGLIWGSTKAFKLKGFVISVSVIILIILGITCFEKFLDYSYNNAPILIIIFFAILAIFLLWIVFITVKENLTSGEETKRKFIKDLIRDLKNLGIALLGGVVIVGLIVVALINN